MLVCIMFGGGGEKASLEYKYINKCTYHFGGLPKRWTLKKKNFNRLLQIKNKQMPAHFQLLLVCFLPFTNNSAFCNFKNDDKTQRSNF